MNRILKEIDILQSEINKHRPLKEPVLSQLKEYYRVGLTYSSNALEGNTLTESETKVVLEDGLTIGGKPLKDHLEALGHSEAYLFLFSLLKNKEISISDIKRLHYLFYYRINRKGAGEFRKIQVFLTGSQYPLPSPERVPSLMEKFIEKLNTPGKKHPVIKAAVAHKDLVFIHPFIDGNGRIARLLMNLVLLREGYNIAIIPPVSRADYISALERAHKDDREFTRFICSVVKETQKDYLRLFKGEVCDL